MKLGRACSARINPFVPELHSPIQAGTTRSAHYAANCPFVPERRGRKGGREDYVREKKKKKKGRKKGRKSSSNPAEDIPL